MLEAETTLWSYTNIAGRGNQSVSVRVHATTVEQEGDFVVFVAVVPLDRRASEHGSSDPPWPSAIGRDFRNRMFDVLINNLRRY
jgi:hypothetical protein